MIGRVALLKVFLNSFFIQSAWSFEKMQGLGFAAAIAPAIRDIYEEKEQVRAALKRHMVFYNAHPYMASPILGAVVRMEQEVKEGKRDAKDIALFKDSLIGPYGAIGDTFFWGSIRPFASVFGVSSALLWGMWGPLVFLTVYNIFHLWMRWFGLYKGYKLGEEVVGYIKSLELPKWALRIRTITTGLLGILLAVAVLKILGIQPVKASTLFVIIVLIITTILLSGLLRKGISITLAIYLLFLPLFAFLVSMGLLDRIGNIITVK